MRAWAGRSSPGAWSEKSPPFRRQDPLRHAASAAPKPLLNNRRITGVQTPPSRTNHKSTETVCLVSAHPQASASVLEALVATQLRQHDRDGLVNTLDFPNVRPNE